MNWAVEGKLHVRKVYLTTPPGRNRTNKNTNKLLVFC